MKELINWKLTRETWKVYFHLCRLFRKIQRVEHSDRATRIISKESKNQDRRLRKLKKEFDALRFQFTRDAEGLHQSGDATGKNNYILSLFNYLSIVLVLGCLGSSRLYRLPEKALEDLLMWC